MSGVTSAMETAWCITVVLGSLLVVGLPVQWLLRGRQPLGEGDWARAPLIAAAAIVLVAQGLVYLDVPVARSTPAVWLVAGVLWVWMWRRRGIRWGAAPLPLLLACLAVYLLHGSGLLWAGARHYVGRAWGDQYNYTVIAEFLREQPFSLTWEQVGLRPYLIMAVFMKEHRIGQSVLHAFFAVSSLRDVKTLLEPTILLSPALAFLSLHELRRAMTGSAARGWTLVACAGCAMLPGWAVLHLEGFLSQCTALPLLLLWPVLLRDVVVDPRWPNMTTACVVFGALTAIYPEVLPVLLGLAALGLGAAAFGHPRRLRLLSAFGLLLMTLGAFALTPALGGLVRTARYVGLPVLGHLYPWALEVTGLTRIWGGDLVELVELPWRAVLHAAALVLTAAGYLGLAQGLIRTARPGGRWDVAGGRVTLALAVGCLVLLPCAVLAQKGEHPYQFYKLCLTIAPLVALGVTLLPAPRTRRLLVALMLSLGLTGTVHLAWQAGRAVPGPRSMAEYLMDDDARGIAGALGALRDQDLVLLQRDPVDRPPGVVNAWLTYLGRRNRVRLGNPMLNHELDLRDHLPLQPILDVGSAPPTAVFLTTPGNPWTSMPAGARLLLAKPRYTLWQASPGPWASLLSVHNPNGLEEYQGQPFFWMGGEDSRLLVLVGQPGTLSLSARFLAVGSPGRLQRIRVRTTGGGDQTFVLGGGPGTLKVAVRAGIQEVRLTPLGPPVRVPPDPRPLALGVLAPEVVLGPDR
jgi:hypothetical protein